MDLGQALTAAKENPGKVYKYMPGNDIEYSLEENCWFMTTEGEPQPLLDFRCTEKYSEPEPEKQLIDELEISDWIYKKSAGSYKRVTSINKHTINVISFKGYLDLYIGISQLNSEYEKVENEVDIKFLNKGRFPRQGKAGDILEENGKIRRFLLDTDYSESGAERLIFFAEDKVQGEK